jgi:hypothetical protein
MKSLYCLALILSLSLSLHAQEKMHQDSVAVVQVIQNMFTAMKTSDTNLLKNCFSPTTIFQTIANKNGVIEIKNQPLQDFINSIGKQSSGSLDERITIDKLLIDDRLASVWTPYQFYYKSTYSHQGVNSFQLVKVNDGWKIQYLIDTRRQ